MERKNWDWFDDADLEIKQLLGSMHHAHKDWICDKNSSSKKEVYKKMKQEVQAKTREMKNRWWNNKPE